MNIFYGLMIGIAFGLMPIYTLEAASLMGFCTMGFLVRAEGFYNGL